MRKINAVISAAIMVLFVIHGTMGAMTLLGVGHINFKYLAWVMAGLIAVHTLIGIILTAKTLAVCKKTARRISGLAVMLFVFFHVNAFSYTTYGVYRLKFFGIGKLISQFGLLASAAVHIITNTRPMLIALGVKKLRPRAGDILLFLSIMLAVMALAFVIYCIRWNFL